jgi:hypothetical protein
MALILVNNLASSVLASAINPASLLLQVAPGDGTKFPSLTPGETYFVMTILDSSNPLVNEIVWVTDKSGDVFTIVRGREGTTAQSWNTGDATKMLFTAGMFDAFSQTPQTQAGSYNYAVDTGTINSYVAAFAPLITKRIPGLTLRIKAATNNSGPSTLNVGAGSFPIVNPDGTPLGAGAIIMNGIFEVVDDGTPAGPYQLISVSNEALSSQGIATTGAFAWRPTNETLAGWIWANATTIGNAASGASQLAAASAANLFAWHWNLFSNTQCPVFTSAGVPTTRGLNAAADFAANKRIQVYDMRGTGTMGVDTMGGAATTRLTGVPVVSGNATTPGSVLGENLHALIISEGPAHDHSVQGNTFNNNQAHDHSYTYPTPGFNAAQGPFPVSGPPGTTNTGNNNQNHDHTLSIQSNVSGAGIGHNTVERSAAGYWSIKL